MSEQPDRALVGRVVSQIIVRGYETKTSFSHETGFAYPTLNRITNNLSPYPSNLTLTLTKLEAALKLPFGVLDYIATHNVDAIRAIDMEPDLKRWILEEVGTRAGDAGPTLAPTTAPQTSSRKRGHSRG